MAAENGREGVDLSERLLREPHRFDFFQAVRLLEWIARERARPDGQRPGAPVGQDAAPEREVVRFRALPSLGFPASPVAQVRQPAAEDGAAWPPPAEMVVSFLGLTGPSGALPQHYTTLLLRRIRERDYALRDFLDLFNHRLVSLFHRAWEKYRLPFAYERHKLGPAGEEADLATWGLYCLAGLGTAGLRGRLEVPDEAFLFYAGHFAHCPRSAAALEGILEDYFELPVRVQPLQGQWLALGAEERSRVPGPGCPKGRNNRLGADLVVGQRVWDVQSKFRVRVGPLGYDEFRRLMPSGDRLVPLHQLTRTYVGPDLDFDVQPVLRAAEVPWCRLRTTGERSRLGWNTWARSRGMGRDVDDAVFSVRAL
jgi:type VI secretion system protein ImpH